MRKSNKLFLWSFALLTFFFTSAFTVAVLADDESDKLLGVWQPSHGKAKVKVTKVGTKYFGKHYCPIKIQINHFAV
jgi:hypothetical protein